MKDKKLGQTHTGLSPSSPPFTSKGLVTFTDVAEALELRNKRLYFNTNPAQDYYCHNPTTTAYTLATYYNVTRLTSTNVAPEYEQQV